MRRRRPSPSIRICQLAGMRPRFVAFRCLMALPVLRFPGMDRPSKSAHTRGWIPGGRCVAILPVLSSGTLTKWKATGVKPCSGLRIPLRDIEIEASVEEPIQPGERTSRARVISEQWSANEVKLVFEGEANAETAFGVLQRRPLPNLKLSSPENIGGDADERPAAFLEKLKSENMKPRFLWLRFPKGEGWKTITVTLTW